MVQYRLYYLPSPCRVAESPTTSTVRRLAFSLLIQVPNIFLRCPGDVGAYTYGYGHSMKPHRIQMTVRGDILTSLLMADDRDHITARAGYELRDAGEDACPGMSVHLAPCS